MLLLYFSFKFIFIAFFILFVFLEKKKLKNGYKLVFIMLYIAFSLYFYLYSYSYEKESSYQFLGRDFEGYVWEVNQNYLVLNDYKLDGKSGKFKILLYTKGDFDVGDKVSGKISDEAYKQYYNEGSFDYNKYQKAKGILGFYKANIKKEKAKSKYFLKRMLNYYRESLATTIRLNMPRNQSILIAILLGIRTFRDLDSVRTAGLIHIFAISGMHLAILTSLVYKLSALFSPKIKLKVL